MIPGIRPEFEGNLYLDDRTNRLVYHDANSGRVTLTMHLTQQTLDYLATTMDNTQPTDEFTKDIVDMAQAGKIWNRDAKLQSKS